MLKGLHNVCSYQCQLEKDKLKPKKEPKPRACAECKKQTVGRNKYCSDKCSQKASKRRKKAKEKTEPKYWMKKADLVASKYYRSKTPYCQAKGMPHEYVRLKDSEEGDELRTSLDCSDQLQWCHIYRRGYQGIRYEEYNHLIMCSSHHSYFTVYPEEWSLFMQVNYPEKYKLASENRNNYCHSTVEHYQSWINKFS